MARGVNKVILIGNLGDEPTIRTTNTGRNVASISMVTNESRRNAETGEYTEFAEWHRVTMWGKLADIAKQYLHKGSQIYVEGKLRTRSYDKDGIKRYVTEIVADEMQMLGSPRNAGGSSYQQASEQHNSSAYDNGYQAPAQNGYNNQNAGGYGGGYGAGAGNGGYGAARNQGYGQQPQAQTVPVTPQEPPMVADNGNIDDVDIPF